MMNFLGYCTDAIHYASGLEVESAYAMAGDLFSETHSSHGVEDCAVVSLALQHGVTATITVGRIPHAPGHGPTSTSMRVLGSHAHAVVDDDRPALEIFGHAPKFVSESFDGGETALRAHLVHVVESSLGGQPSDYSATDARRSIAVIDACYRSTESGTAERPS